MDGEKDAYIRGFKLIEKPSNKKVEQVSWDLFKRAGLLHGPVNVCGFQQTTFGGGRVALEAAATSTFLQRKPGQKFYV